MDLEARVAALEAEVNRLRASQGIVTAPFRVQSPDGKTLVEIGINDAGRAEIQLFDPTGTPVIKVLSEEGGSAILIYADDDVAGVALRANKLGGCVELWGHGGHSTVSLTTPVNVGGRLELSDTNGNSGVALGTEGIGKQPSLRIYNDSGDILADLGADAEGGGHLQVLASDGWGLHHFPPLSNHPTPPEP